MTANTPQKAPSAEVRVENQRFIQQALHTPKIAVPSFLSFKPKTRGAFSNVERIELTSNDLKAVGEAILKPTPAPNECLAAAIKRANKW